MGGDGALGMVVFLGWWCSWEGGVLGMVVFFKLGGRCRACLVST